jgi:hypothetical protein
MVLRCRWGTTLTGGPARKSWLPTFSWRGGTPGERWGRSPLIFLYHFHVEAAWTLVSLGWWQARPGWSAWSLPVKQSQQFYNQHSTTIPRRFRRPGTRSTRNNVVTIIILKARGHWCCRCSSNRLARSSTRRMCFPASSSSGGGTNDINIICVA